MTDVTLAAAEAPSRLARWAAAWKPHERRILVAGVVAQALVLGGMIMSRAMPLLIGETLLLRVVPVDPRDLFRGDYVELSYDFSRIGPQGIDGQQWPLDDPQQWSNRPVYAGLVPDGDGRRWRLARLTFARPSAGTYLSGRTAGWNRLEFGIESYYVQEGEGRRYEEALRRGQLWAEVKVTADGQALLRSLSIEPQ